jgi:site-specific DNA recombinase
VRAVGYFRRPAGQRSADAISRQNRAFLDYCERQGYEVVSTFAEEDEGREGAGFGQLIEYLRRPEKGFAVVVVQSPAVLADDPAAAASRLLQIESLGAQVQAVEGGGDPLSAVVRAWAEGAASSLSERVRSAMRKKAVRGEVLGRPPYGYKVGSRGRLEIVPEEAVVVRYIFRLYLQEGLGIRLIAARLNEEGIATRRDRPWSMVSIRDILRNRAYLGTYQRLGVRVPGTHPALVSPEDFRKVQERLSERRTNYSPRQVSPFLLSGLAVCAYCGNRLIGVSRRQTWKRGRDGETREATYRYYQCESRTNQGLCDYHTRRAEVLEAEVRDRILDLDATALAGAGDDAAVIERLDEDVRRLRDRVQQVERRVQRLVESAAAARLSTEGLRSRGLRLAEERLRLEEEVRSAERRAAGFSSAAGRKRAKAAALDRLKGGWETLPFAEKQGLLRELVERVVVGDDEVRLALLP